MNQNELVAKPLSQVGEDIGLAEGAAMVQAYRQANPADTISHFIGREVIEQLLAQPGCAGINIASAAKENGERTLVFVGVDAAGEAILSYPVVNAAGQLDQKDGVVADRIRTNSDDFWEEMLRTIFGF
jgi:hypothetical protein